MPRFVAKPIIIEAVQWTGHTHMWPEAFRMAVLRHLPNGTVEINTGDGPRPCQHGSWVMHGPDGAFSVVRRAAFEAMFKPYVAEATSPPAEPIPARADKRRIA